MSRRRRSLDADPFRDPEEMRARDARLSIAAMLGRRQSSESPLTKATLNSMYRYLTGSFAFPPKAYGTSASPPADELRDMVVIHLANEGYDHFQAMLLDGDGEVLDARDSVVQGAFDVDTLRALVVALRDHPDRRPAERVA